MKVSAQHVCECGLVIDTGNTVELDLPKNAVAFLDVVVQADVHSEHQPVGMVRQFGPVRLVKCLGQVAFKDAIKVERIQLAEWDTPVGRHHTYGNNLLVLIGFVPVAKIRDVSDHASLRCS
jgi:hypothetical protein